MIFELSLLNIMNTAGRSNLLYLVSCIAITTIAQSVLEIENVYAHAIPRKSFMHIALDCHYVRN